MSCMGAVFGNGALRSVCGEQPVVLTGLFGDIHGTPLANLSGYNPVLVLEESLIQDMAMWDSNLLIIGDFIRITFICFRKFPLN